MPYFPPPVNNNANAPNINRAGSSADQPPYWVKPKNISEYAKNKTIIPDTNITKADNRVRNPKTINKGAKISLTKTP